MKGLRFILVVILLLAGAVAVNDAFAQQKQKAKSEEEIGLRREPLSDESREMPAHGEYGKIEPGKSKPLGRAFENSPRRHRRGTRAAPV